MDTHVIRPMGWLRVVGGLDRGGGSKGTHCVALCAVGRQGRTLMCWRAVRALGVAGGTGGVSRLAE